MKKKDTVKSLRQKCEDLGRLATQLQADRDRNIEEKERWRSKAENFETVRNAEIQQRNSEVQQANRKADLFQKQRDAIAWAYCEKLGIVPKA